MAARAFMEQVRTVILQRRVRETQSRSEPAGAFQSLIAHIIHRDNRNLPKTGRFHPRLSPLNSRFEPKQGMLQAAIMLHGGIAGGLITLLSAGLLVRALRRAAPATEATRQPEAIED